MNKIKATINLRSEETASSYQQGVPLPLWRILLDLFPEYYNGKIHSLVFEFDNENEFYGMLLNLSQLGLDVPYDRASQSLFSAQLTRSYSESDIKSAPLLSPYCVLPVADGGYDQDGNFAIIRNITKRAWGSMGGFLTNVLCCRDEVREKLENSGLKQLKFREMAVMFPEKLPKNHQPIYQLTSDLILPPSSNWLFDNKGHVWKASDPVQRFPHGCLPLERWHIYPEYHYREIDLKIVPEFDFALTHERIGSQEPCRHDFVCSQRFREVLKELKLPTKFSPIRVDSTTWKGGIDGSVHPGYTFAGRTDGPFTLE